MSFLDDVGDLRWCSRRSERSKRSKAQNCKAFKIRPRSRPKMRFPPLLSVGGWAPRVILTYDSVCTAKETRMFVELALSSWNENSVSKHGPEYELVKTLECRQIPRTLIFHCNFIGKLKNQSEAEEKLFFAEVKYSTDLIQDGKTGGYGCHLCCILEPSASDTESEESVCLCCRFSVVQHPEGGFTGLKDL